MCKKGGNITLKKPNYLVSVIHMQRIRKGSQKLEEMCKRVPKKEKQFAQIFVVEFLAIFKIDKLDAKIEHFTRFDNQKHGWMDSLLDGVALFEFKTAPLSKRRLEHAIEQAKRYWTSLPTDTRPPIIIICDFDFFWFLEPNTCEVVIHCKLSELHLYYYVLEPFFDYSENQKKEKTCWHRFFSRLINFLRL